MRIRILVLAVCVLLGIATIESGDSGKIRRHSSNSAKGDDIEQVPEQDRVSGIFESYDASMSEKQVKERLDALGLYLKNAPSFRAYIVSYGGRRSCRGEALMRAQRAKNYLSKVKGINRQRINTMDAGFQEEWTVELWTTAEGAFAPTPMPTADRRDVQIIRNCKLNTFRRKKHGS